MGDIKKKRKLFSRPKKLYDRARMDEENILVKKYELLEIDVGVQKTDNFSAKAKRVIKERIYNNLPLFLRPTLYFFYH